MCVYTGGMLWKEGCQGLGVPGTALDLGTGCA